MDIYYVDIVTGEFVQLIQVANFVLRYWSVQFFMVRGQGKIIRGRDGVGGIVISQLGENLYQGMRKYLTISTNSISIPVLIPQNLYQLTNLWSNVFQFRNQFHRSCQNCRLFLLELKQKNAIIITWISYQIIMYSKQLKLKVCKKIFSSLLSHCLPTTGLTN